MRGAVVEVALAQLRAGVDCLLAADCDNLAGTEVTKLVAEVEVQRRRLEALDHQLIAEVEARRLAGDYARTSTADLLVSLLRISPREAKARVTAAADMGPRRSLTGEPLPRLFPLVAAAQGDGTISAAHARIVTDTVDALPADLAVEAAPIVERLLVDAARQCDPTIVARTGRELLARIDQDGVEPTDRDHQRRRSLTFAERRDGSGRISGDLTPEALAVWRTVVDALSAPVPADDCGERDDRSPAQRRHDGLLEAGRRVLRSATLPSAGGATVTVQVTMTAAQLMHRTGYATTAHGSLISVAGLLLAAAEAEVIPVVLNDTGGIVSYGRSHRIATCAQRRALAARDGGCAFPGCTRPASWCEAHHVIAWIDGGPTDIDNLVLLCGYHHREFEARGWVLRMADGVPRWIPPPWLDPDQKPMRNAAHHHELDFDQLPVQVSA